MQNQCKRGAPRWAGRFKGCGYRLTIPRQAVYEVLRRTEKHLSADDVFMEVRKLYPGVGLTSIYRTLELLVKIGDVTKFDFGDGRSRYELGENAKGIGHHHHLVCTGCGRIVDYTDFIKDEIELLQRTEKGLSKKFNFKIKNHLIQFYGLCEKCAGKADSTGGIP